MSAITSGRETCEQIITGYLNRINQYNSTLGAVVSINPLAAQEARKLDDEFRTTKKVYEFLHCAPVLVKDSIDVKGMATTMGLNAFRQLIPNTDAEVIKSVRKYGAIILGKANMSPLSDKEAWGKNTNTLLQPQVG